MFGHTARHIITQDRRVPGAGACSSGSESEMDGWYIDSSVLPEWRRPTLDKIGIVPGFSSDCRDKIEAHRSGAELGVPIKVTMTKNSLRRRPHGSPDKAVAHSSMEVIEFSEAPLDPALFEVLPDFRQVTQFTNVNPPKAFTPTTEEKRK